MPLKARIIVLASLLAFALLADGIANFKSELNTFLALCLFLGVCFSCLPLRLPQWRSTLLLAALIVFSLVAVAWGWEPLLAGALFMTGVALLHRMGGRATAQSGQSAAEATSHSDDPPLPQSRALETLALTGTGFGLLLLGYRYSAQMWCVLQWVGWGLSLVAGALWRREINYGATAAGVTVLLLFVLHALSAFVLSARGARERGVLVRWLLALLAAHLLYLGMEGETVQLVRLLDPEINRYWITWTSLNMRLVLFLLLSVPGLFYMRGMLQGSLPSGPSPPRGWTPLGHTTRGLGLLALAVLVLTLEPAGTKKQGRIYVHDENHVEWSGPVFGLYGETSGGTFGPLLPFLRAAGYSVSVGPISKAVLKKTDILAVIDLQRRFSPAEKAALWDFVARGGALLVMGDHTDVLGILDPLNDVLDPVRIRFNFDSAYYFDVTWDAQAELRPHPITYGLHDGRETSIIIGASLSLSSPAEPIVVGKYGWSDAGDRRREDQGFLGDTQYRPGERLGDLILVAGARYGQGKVLVFGDTASFHTYGIPEAKIFLEGVFRWLNVGDKGKIYTRNPLLALLLFGGALYSLARAGVRLRGLAGLLLTVGLALGVTSALNLRALERLPLQGKVAIVDSSHQGRFNMYGLESGSALGFFYNLMRNGYVAFLAPAVDEAALRAAKLVVMIAPARSFSAADVAKLTRWVRAGGMLLLSVGWEEQKPCHFLLRAFGIEIDALPLGPASALWGESPIRFYKAWGVRAAGADVLLQYEGIPLAIQKAVGRGHVIMIGDSSFLLGEHLEGRAGYQEAKILFLRDILVRYGGGEEAGQ